MPGIRGSGVCRQWNGIEYKLGMSGRNVGATALSMNVAVIPPGGIAGAHIHVGFEVMLYILEGRVRHDYGDGLVHRVEQAVGDFIFIEPGVPHEVYNQRFGAYDTTLLAQLVLAYISNGDLIGFLNN